MRVFEVMTEGVQTVPPTMPASDAWELMRRQRIHHLVVTHGSDIVGVLSERDTGSRLGARARIGHTVADFMIEPGRHGRTDRHASGRRQADARPHDRLRCLSSRASVSSAS